MRDRRGHVDAQKAARTVTPWGPGGGRKDLPQGLCSGQPPGLGRASAPKELRQEVWRILIWRPWGAVVSLTNYSH